MGVERLDAHVLLALPDREARCAAFDDERREPVGRRGVDEDLLGARGERHQALLAGEDVAAALPLGPSGQRRRVEVPARLDEGRRPDRELGSREARQPALALLLGPRHEKRDGEETGGEEVQGERQVAIRQLLEDEGAGDRRAGVPVAAERFRDQALHEPELPAALDDGLRNRVLLVGLARRGSEDLAREACHGLADELLLVRRLEVHHALLPPETATPLPELSIASHAVSCSTSVSRTRRRSISSGSW